MMAGISPASANSDGMMVRNPADRRQVVGFAPPMEKDGVDAAVARAGSAFARWSVVPANERRKALLSVASSFEVESEGLARLLTMEVGKPLAEAPRP